MTGTKIVATPSPAGQNGYTIRALRNLSGLSVQQLADAADVTAPHMRNIELENRNASPRHLALIARALGVPVAALTRSHPEGTEAADAAETETANA